MNERDEQVMKNGDIGQGEYLVEAKYRKEKNKEEEKKMEWFVCTIYHIIINITLSMKKERQTKPLRKVESGLPQIDQNGFNQTIIINNPNININYIENQAGSKAKNNKTIIETTLYNQKNDSKGIDTWNLNKNLK